LPIEKDFNLHPRDHFQYEQAMKIIEPVKMYKYFELLQRLDREIAKSFVLAIRLYHAAVEMMYTEPEFSYLFLVMSLESIASKANEDFVLADDDFIKFLNSKYPGWDKLSEDMAQEDKQKFLDILLCQDG
jgi:hypothetical protein